MVICYNEEDYIGFCLDSIKDIVDEIIIIDGGSTDDTVNIISDKLKGKEYKLIEDLTRDHYAHLRNSALEMMVGDWVLILDGDEILANINGSECTREQLEKLMEHNVRNIFTIHFMYDYHTIDGRYNAQHFSLARFYDKKVIAGYRNRMHELPVPTGTVLGGKLGVDTNMSDPIIWHFAGCKSIEKNRKKFAQCRRICEKYPDTPYATEILSFPDNDTYCRNHEIFKKTRPLINYYGPLPKVMKLW